MLVTASLALAGVAAFALQHEMRSPATTKTTAIAPGPTKAQPKALTAEEERYAAAVWDIQREVTSSAVAMSSAGIAYKMDGGDLQELERKIQPRAEFFRQAEARARAILPPESMSALHRQYVEAMGLYLRAAEKTLHYTETGQDQHLVEAQKLSITASEDTLRVGDVLWPGYYKPH